MVYCYTRGLSDYFLMDTLKKEKNKLHTESLFFCKPMGLQHILITFHKEMHEEFPRHYTHISYFACFLSLISFSPWGTGSWIQPGYNVGFRWSADLTGFELCPDDGGAYLLVSGWVTNTWLLLCLVPHSSSGSELSRELTGCVPQCSSTALLLPE